MKILLIHSDGVEVTKTKQATSKPQKFDDDVIKMDGLVLIAYVSVEDQDTYDTDIISKQGATVIEEAIIQISNFPEKIRQKNEQIRAHNKKIDDGKVKGKKRKIIELIKDKDMYRVDKVLVYPWAHLSKFLSNEPNAMEVCPKIAKNLEEKGIEAKFSPFGWYKSFKINCLGHEVAEMYRDVKLYIQPEEHVENTQFFVITPEGKEIKIQMDENKNVLPIKAIDDDDFYLFLQSELGTRRVDLGEEPPHIKVMKEFELTDFEKNSDSGNLRWYTKGVIMKNIIKNYLDEKLIDFGAIFVDTPIMYTVKNKKLTAQTARFPARTYWVESGNNRFLLRYAGDFLQFDMFSEMNLKPQYFPLRLYEYEHDFRREQEGELTGLRRLRGFVMPDFHTLCKDLNSSIEEFRRQYELNIGIAKDLGVKDQLIFRTTKDFYDDNKIWIKELIKEENKPALLELWEDRYYYFVLKFERGVLSAQNKSGTLATLQIDVESTLEYLEEKDGKKREKYNINFIDLDGKKKHPIILHNSPSGGLERILWGLIETAIRDKEVFVPGFKTWLAPIQIRVLTVNDEQNEYAEKILKFLNEQGYRTDFDDREEKLGKKIRQAEIEWIPYSIVLGKKEQENQTISIRKRLISQKFAINPKNQQKMTFEQHNNIKLELLIDMLEEETKGYPKHKLPIPFRKFSTKIYFRH